MKYQQRGGTILGFILGLVVGLGAALGVAVYVSKVPVPFLDKAGLRGAGQDEIEAEKNKNWDPNSPLYGKNPARPNVPAAVVVDTPAPDTADAADALDAAPAATAAKDAKDEKQAKAAAKEAKDVKEAKEAKEAKAKKDAASADPLGDLAKARTQAAAATNANANTDSKDPFVYFVQAGAFRSQSDADAQRAKLAMQGWQAQVSEREQSGRTVFRLRLGPFDQRAEADQTRTKLDGAGVESNLVRVQR